MHGRIQIGTKPGLVGKVAAVALSVVLVVSMFPSGAAWAIGDSIEAAQGSLDVQEADVALTLDAATLSAQSSVTGNGTVTLIAGSQQGATLQDVQEGTVVKVSAVAAKSDYLAQVRVGREAVAGNADSLVYESLTPDAQGNYSFTMPGQNVQVVADFVSIVWDGTIDVTWYNTTDNSFSIRYAAQYAGLAAIVNGIFTNYPTSPNDKDVQICDYDKYLAKMGTKWQDAQGKVLTELPSNISSEELQALTVLGSACYGEFTSNNCIFDTQGQEASSSLSADIAKWVTSTQRVVGNPDYVKANFSEGVQREGSQNLTSTSTYFFGIDSFNNKTVNIVGDLDFGGVKRADGTWSTEESPLFMPVGGQYIMLPLVIEKQDAAGEYVIDSSNGYNHIGSSFCGTLDGHGHSISNVYCERYGYGTNFGDSQSVGLIGRLGIHDNDYKGQGVQPPVNPTVRCIVLESGYVSSRRGVAGIVGKIGHTSATDLNDGSTGGIIEYCINKADTFNTDAKGVAGICADSWNGGVVRYCANFGTVTSTYSDPEGGIVAYNENSIINCYNVGKVVSTHPESNARFCMGIASHNGGSYEITNNYWLLGSAQNDYLSTSYQYGGYYGITKGTTQGESNNGTWSFGGTITTWDGKVTYAADYSTLTADMLNGDGPSIWKDDATGVYGESGINDGYPVLYFQEEGYVEAPYTVDVQQPETGGTISISASSGSYGTQVTITPKSETGYVPDTYYVNGQAIEGDSFIITGNSTVTATFRELSSYTFHYDTPDTSEYTFSATKDGTVIEGGVATQQLNVPIAEGDKVYQGDIIYVSLTLKEGAAPEDATKEYSGNYSLKLAYANGTTQAAQSKLLSSSQGTLSYAVTGDEDMATGFTLSCASLTKVTKTWNLHADTSWYYSAEAGETFVISTAEQLAGLNVLLGQKVSFEGLTITLGQDISLENPDGTGSVRYWEPQKSTAYAFKGTFDGAGHTISGMTCDYSAVSGNGSYAALMGYADGATLRNLTVCGTAAGNYNAAGIVGNAQDCTLQNLVSKVKVTTANASSAAGGIVAKMVYGSMSGLVNHGAVESKSSSANASYGTGGICGLAQSVKVSGCLNRASVSAAGGYVGGIVGSASANGYAEHGATELSDCGNFGTVSLGTTTAGNAAVGGMVGYGTYTSLDGCLNAGDVSIIGGTVSSNMYVGGMMGYCKKSSGWTVLAMANCANVGKVSATSQKTTGQVDAGGIVGCCYDSDWDISNSYSTGLVSATGGASDFVGQIVGKRGTSSATSGYAYAISNSYYLSATTVSSFDIGATAVASDTLKGYAETLGEAFTASTPEVTEVFPGLAGGYPVQTWVEDAAKFDIAEASMEEIGTQEFTGSAIEPKITLSLGGKTLVAGTDYAVEFANNVDTGRASVTITGMGRYAGVRYAGFDIVCTKKGISQQPQSLSAEVNEYLFFSVVATGQVKSYEWQCCEFNGQWHAAASCLGYQTSEVSAKMTTQYDGCQWRCLITFSDETTMYSDVAVSQLRTKSHTVGDVNDNGCINIVDAQIVLDMANGVWTSEGSIFDYDKLISALANDWDVVTVRAAADFNGDKVVDALDARAIQAQALS